MSTLEHEDPDAPAQPRARTYTRDPEDVRLRLDQWLCKHLERPAVSAVSVPESNGMSSDTVLFDVSYIEDGATRTTRCAARLSPDPSGVPVFPSYDLERQFRVMRLVGERSEVPVPETLWLEPDEIHLGSPFFVMEAVEGLVPPDVMPYPFGSWVTEGSARERRHLQESAVEVLAQIHAIEADPADLAFLELRRPGGTALRRHVADLVAYYEWVASDGVRSPLIERALSWIFDHWPASEAPTAISWGDARIGNMMFRDFEPVAVLDWEMAALGPPEIDLAWMIYLHRFLDDIAVSAGLEGMGRFMHLEDVASTYEDLSGHTPRDLEFFTLYAALRHAVVMSRIARRQVILGDITMPEDPDDMIMHRVALEQMLEGTYWGQF